MRQKDEPSPTNEVQEIDVVEEEVIIEQEDQVTSLPITVAEELLQELTEWVNPQVKDQVEMKEDRAKVTEEEQKQGPVTQETEEQTMNKKKSEITLSQKLQEDLLELVQEMLKEITMEKEQKHISWEEYKMQEIPSLATMAQIALEAKNEGEKKEKQVRL